MHTPALATPAHWLAARRELLAREKEFTRARDDLSRARRALPWVQLTKSYTFDAPSGRVSLADLFAGRSQLIVQHFMFGPGWEEGCPNCSFMLDHFAPTVAHLAARDVAFAAVSRAPMAEILPFQQRLGWPVNWVSSAGSDFNFDFHVSFRPDEMATGAVDYNYTRRPFPHSEAPGISVFARDDAGALYHTYSTYGRGVEVIMGTYALLDLVPKGRDEDALEYASAWIRYHDRYEHASSAT
ncbi:DUF899 domain-containing protein [Horticoccus luteus]|uniref:DUF899 domain-containing protein n=1 Tax=Horticoccus luteus TaxID=2862869 RepID=A0A8F9TXC1_9BACT|nr:thioredoxin family protein [Horticoccus luteus]QYM79473.1 DUF899 domain-containing protein [Horticoccus luteus]